MSTVLGLLGMIVFIVCVIAFAAGVTWLVVRLTPSSPRQARSSSTGSPS